MKFGILLSDVAIDDLRKLPGPVRQSVRKQLGVLGEHAVLLSVPSHFPYPQKCQLFRFDCNESSDFWEITILFQYAQDESNIHVVAIGRWHRPLAEMDEVS